MWKYKTDDTDKDGEIDTTCYCNAAKVGSNENNVITYATLSVNNEELRVTKDLQFYIPNSERLKIYLNGRMNLGNGCTIKTPDLKQGQIVVIDCASGSTSSERIITCTNLTTFKDTVYAASKGRMIYMGYVTEDGAVTISTASSDGAMNFYKIRVMANSTSKTELESSEVSITLNDYGVRTYSSNLPLDFSSSSVSSLKAYVVSTYTGVGANGKITLTSVEKVPPYTGVILLWDTTTDKPESATVKFCVPSAVETNYLLPSVETTEVAASTSSAYNYVFGKKTENNETKIGFYYIESKSFKSSENKAYLSIPRALAEAKGSTAKFIALDFSDGEGETTGISNVKATNVDDAYYTLSGVKVAQPRKGLYIKNGKKVIVK